MDKRQYFALMMRHDMYKHRQWIVDSFCVVKNRKPISEASYFGELVIDAKDPDKLYFFDNTVNPPMGRVITGSSVNEALFNAKEPVMYQPDEIPLIKEETKTTYGIILANMVLIYYPFQGKIGFSHKVIGKWIENEIISRMAEYPPEGEEKNPNSIYVDEYEKLTEGCGFLASLSPIFTSSGSERALTVAPEVLALRDKLLKEHAGNLRDKTTLALIEDQLVKADKASFQNDDAKDYLIGGKDFNPTRKKMLILIGGTSGFGQDGKIDFIGGSLRDKWKIEDIPLHTDEARSGSYNRGKETQFGGADVKTAYRMTMSMSVSDGFCGTKRGKPFTILESTPKSKFIGRYVVTTNGPVEITEEVFPKLIGKSIAVYSPQYCRADGSQLCPVCVGRAHSLLKKGLPSVVANIGDVFMYDKMKRMHGKPLEPIKLDFNSLFF